MRWKDRLILCSVRVLGSVFSLFSRLREPFLPPAKRAKHRELRERLANIQRDQRILEKRINDASGPEEVLKLSREFADKYGDQRDRSDWEETFEPVRAIEREGEILQSVLKETGEDFPTAATRYREYVQENPATRLGRTYLAGTLRQMGKWDEALEVLRELQQAERELRANYPGDQITRISIGQVLYDKGEFDAAIAEFESLLQDKSEIARALYGAIYLSLGTAYFAKGQRKQAHDAWKKAIKHDKNSVVVDQARELLKNNPLKDH